MEGFFHFYQNLPLFIQPTAFRVGFFGISWYALMYVLAFATVYGLLKYRIRKKEFIPYDAKLNGELLLDFMFYAVIGVLVGGRLGYVFYDWKSFLGNPIEIFSPYDFQSGRWIGIYGMSYHGGLIGTLIASWIFSKKNGLDFWNLANFVIPAVPLGYFFGRIGNFLNGELYGRMTESRWGMNFGDGVLRIPNQLLEAFFEGIAIFLLLWSLRNKANIKDYLLSIYLCSYALIRFLLDFIREPDFIYAELGGVIAWSQVFSLAMFLLGVSLWLWKRSRIGGIMGK